MKKTVFFLMLSLIGIATFAQDPEKAEKLIEEGIHYHDKGDFEGAISRYDQALQKDKDNLYALAEKALSLLSIEKYDESIECCKTAIAKHPGDKGLPIVYVTYGNALDGKKKTDESIKIYDEGIKIFPDFHYLYFNKGVSLASVKRNDEALICFQKSAQLNPGHASSHNAIARISHSNKKRIPALMAYCRFLALEPVSKRAAENLDGLKEIMVGSVEETGKKSITIYIDPDVLGDTTASGQPNENSFAMTDLILSMDAALDYDKKNKKKTEVEQFIRKFETICASLEEGQKDNYGFYWDYYVPYFVAMKNKNLIEPFAYIAFATSDDTEASKWIKSNKNRIEEFFEWSKSFEWK